VAIPKVAIRQVWARADDTAMVVVLVLGAWCLVSVPAGLLAGAVLRRGNAGFDGAVIDLRAREQDAA
jgi:hypothetical protein